MYESGLDIFIFHKKNQTLSLCTFVIIKFLIQKFGILCLTFTIPLVFIHFIYNEHSFENDMLHFQKGNWTRATLIGHQGVPPGLARSKVKENTSKYLPFHM